MAKEKDADFVVPPGRRSNSKASEAFIKRLGHIPQYHGALYLKDFINPERLQERIDLTVRALKGHKFDAIAFMGMSGALIAPPVALAVGKPFILVRKDDNTHSGWNVEGDYAAKTFIVVDDFTETGKTIKNIRSEIRRVMPSAKYLGFLGAKWLTPAGVAQYEKKKVPYPLG